MKKKVLSIILVGALVASLGALAGCNSSDSSSSGSSDSSSGSSDSSGDSGTDTANSDITVGIVVKTATNAHFQDIAYGAMLAGKDLGITVKVDNTASEADVEGQITKCENMISSGVDALILTANDSDGVSAAVDAAHDAGIPFVTVDTEITNVWGDDVKEYMPDYIGVDHTKMAYELAKDVLNQIGNEGNVVIIRGVDAASSSQERTEGFEQAIDEQDGVTLIQSQSADYDQDTATTTMADIIQANKDIDAVLCCNDLMAVGVCTAFEENGIDVNPDDGVVVAGIDGNYIALQSIDDNVLYATAYDWSILQGYDAVEQAYDLILGEEVPELTYTPDTIITKENVDEYLPHGEELDQWSMGSQITEVSTYMRDFLEMGQELEAEGSSSSSTSE